MTSTRSAKATALPSPHPSILDPETFPDVYGLAVTGNCMAPDYPDGCKVKVSKTEAYCRGDVVVVWFRSELVKPDGLQCIIKRLAMAVPPWVKAFPYRDHPQSEVLALLMLQANDRPDALLRVRCADIRAIHKCVGVLAPTETGGDCMRVPKRSHIAGSKR